METNPPISSSNYINKTTTTALPEDWQKINLAPLESIGFTQKHLADIYKTQMADSTVVQTSILHFAYGLAHNKEKYQKYKDPLNMLIGVLRKGERWYESNYESPQALALKELAKQQEVENQQLKIYEEQLIAAKFEEWKLNLSAEEKDQYLPKLNGKLIGAIEAHLQHYFITNIWPKIRPTEISA